MRKKNLLSFIVIFLSILTIFNSCTKEPIQDEFEQITLGEEGFTNSDIDINVETADARNLCQIEVCATFTGSGEYRVGLPNGSTISVDLDNQIIILNGPNGPQQFPWSNPFCATIPVNMSSMAQLGFKGTGSVVVTAQVLPNGPVNTIFSAGVGTNNLVVVEQNVTLNCPPTPVTCNVEVCATFDGDGKYVVELPNGATIAVNLTDQEIFFINPSGGVQQLPWANPFCAVIPINGSSTAQLAFEGTGSVVVTSQVLPGGPVNTIFSAGVGTNNSVSVEQVVTLSCITQVPLTCDIEICAEFTGTGKYGVSLPNGSFIEVDLASQTVILFGPNGPQQLPYSNPFCATITIPTNGSSTAQLGFKGTGSVEVTGDWMNGGPPCDIFDAGVGIPFFISEEETITLSCVPPC